MLLVGRATQGHHYLASSCVCINIYSPVSSASYSISLVLLLISFIHLLANCNSLESDSRSEWYMHNIHRWIMNWRWRRHPLNLMLQFALLLPSFSFSLAVICGIYCYAPLWYDASILLFDYLCACMHRLLFHIVRFDGFIYFIVISCAHYNMDFVVGSI